MFDQKPKRTYFKVYKDWQYTTINFIKFKSNKIIKVIFKIK